MNRALEIACAYGLNVRFADLGDWGRNELRSEYHPSVREIRLNLRVAATLSRSELRDFVAVAVAHELYHHREYVGEIVTLRDRIAREAAACQFAKNFLERR